LAALEEQTAAGQGGILVRRADRAGCYELFTDPHFADSCSYERMTGGVTTRDDDVLGQAPFGCFRGNQADDAANDAGIDVRAHSESGVIRTTGCVGDDITTVLEQSEDLL
jgi:hypothetical protein